MKKIILFLSLILAFIVFVGCDSREKLYVLNWEEYINKDLIREFEKEFNVKVVLDTATSNEAMYNKKKAGVKELVENNGWKVFFEREIIPAGVSVGMYDSSRDAVAAAELYLNYSLNETSAEKLNEIETLLKNNFYSQWGTDELKSAVVSQNLDIALVYSGDYFDQVFLALETETEITFDMYVPTENNNIWFDAMVIPTTATKVDLAHQFINFFLDYDNALENASYVGYCSTMFDVYEAMKEDEELSDIVLHPGYYPGNVNGEPYRNLGAEIALRMDDILTKAKIR